jgi:NitT/TauT family transport system substrate-binding protein
VWIGYEQGLFREHGLEVELAFLSGTRSDQAVISGDTPIAFGMNVATTRLGGGDVVAIADVVGRIPSNLWGRRDILSPEGLRGKSIATTLPGASVTTATLVMLRHFGLEPYRDVTIQTAAGAPEKFALVAQGFADAGLMSPPDDLKSQEIGLVEIANLVDLNIPFLFGAVGTTKAYARDHAEEIRRFLRGYVAAVALARRSPEVAIPIISQYTRTDDMRQVEHGYRFHRDIWGRPDFRVSPAAVASVLRVIDVPGADTARPEDFIDNSFVDELHNSGFIRQSGAFDH